ncbi:four helix bundle protein [Negadavirga shengliensis]|uniref:Four helix bundle protein n=1 Tax=Negadavirga shengliensis TaxID=1389218 RepID=A0ABV9T1V5_9BACT
MKQDVFNEVFRNRTKALALKVVRESEEIKYSDALGIIRKQLIRSVTSTAANFRAVCRARSERERFAKLCIVVEEADESLFWMELLLEGEFITTEKIAPLYQEAEEILKVMSSFKSKFKS